MRLKLVPTAVLRVLIGLSLALFVIHSLVAVAADATGRTGAGPITGVMNLAIDSAVPTWFASALLAGAGLLAFALAGRAAQRADRFAWIGLGVVGFLLAIDEVATIHERWGEVVSGTAFSSDVLGYSWVLGGLVLVSAFAVIYLPFLFRLEARTRWLLIAAGLIFLIGAIGFEIVNGRIELNDPTGDRYLMWSLLTGVEELMEFVGASLLVYALLDALAGPRGTVSVVIDRDSALAGDEGSPSAGSEHKEPSST